MLNANNIKFRASGIGYLMTEARSKSESLSETTKSHLIDVFVSEKYGRKKDISNKYIEKGLAVEDDSITLLSRYTKRFYLKNDERLFNDFIQGEPDLFEGESIHNAEMIIDIKSSWDIFTFFRTKKDKLNKMYFWQLQSYMWLTGAKESQLIYCLVNTPDMIINDEKRKLMWKMGAIDENETTDKAFAEMERAMTFDDIPLDERINIIRVERDENAIEQIKNRVIECRDWMNSNLF
jgi:hypothetical protein